MNKLEHSPQQGDILRSSFIVELQSRTSFVPFKSDAGNDYISINLRNCTQEFLRKTEKFLHDNAERFQLHVRGLEYYVEVLGGDKYPDAYEKSYHDEI